MKEESLPSMPPDYRVCEKYEEAISNIDCSDGNDLSFLRKLTVSIPSEI